MTPTSCPWQAFTPTTLSFCETVRCAWIAQPANAFSNFAYVTMGFWILKSARANPGTPLARRALGGIAITVGAASFAYHSSMTFAGEVLDLGSMYLLSTLLLTLNLRRIGLLPAGAWVPVYAGISLLSVTALIALKTVGILIFALQVGAALLLELFLAIKREQVDRRAFFAALGLFAVSYLFWILDHERILCEPDHPWLQGHAAWHIVNAGVFGLLFRFYAQFDPPQAAAV